MRAWSCCCRAATSGWERWKGRNVTLADNDCEVASLASAIAEHTARSRQAAQLILRRTAMDENVGRARASPARSPCSCARYEHHCYDTRPLSSKHSRLVDLFVRFDRSTLGF